MKYFFLNITLIAWCCATGQDGYYVTKEGDTVQCEFKKVLPGMISVKTEKKGTSTFSPEEIRGFTRDGVSFASKKIMNQKKHPFIFLPNDKADRKYLYSDPNLVMISGRGVTFYDLTEFIDNYRYGGRAATTTLYIENDSLGLTQVPHVKAIGGNTEEIDVINALYNYLKVDEAVEKKLNVNESWKTFNHKGIRKLIEEFMGKKFVDD